MDAIANSADIERRLGQILLSSQPDAMLLADMRDLLSRGAADASLALAERFRDSRAGACSAEVALLHAQLLLARARVAEAVEMFAVAIQAAPGNGAAHLGLAIASGESGMAAAAEASARRAIALGHATPGAYFVLGRASYELDRFDEAERAFRQAASAPGGHLGAQTSLAELVWMRGDGLDAALAVLADRGARRVELCLARAGLLEQAGMPERAYAELASWLQARGEHVDLHLGAARSAMRFDTVRALQHTDRALRLAPGSRAALALHGDALYAVGRPTDAAALAQRLLQDEPDDSHALALQACAWRASEDPRYQSCRDYGSLVYSSVIDVPPGWSSLDAYLGELAHGLAARHARLLEAPPSQSLRTGTQIELRPAHDAEPAVRAFPAAVDGAIRRYLQVLQSRNNAFGRRHTGRYRYSGMWSVRLRANGHHRNHYHGKGWISSACHIVVPPGIGEADRGGWLKFGEPGLPSPQPQPPEYHVQPQPGLLTLFPSWMWHGTEPFAGTERDARLSVAFDLVPE